MQHKLFILLDPRSSLNFSSTERNQERVRECNEDRFLHLFFIPFLRECVLCSLQPHIVISYFVKERTYKKLHKPSYNNALALLRIIIAAVWSHSTLFAMLLAFSFLILSAFYFQFLLSLAVIWCVHFIFINKIENCLLPHSFHHEEKLTSMCR